MGHQRLGVLPATRPWNAIRELIESDAPAADVGDRVLEAVVALLGDADKDRHGRLASEPGVLHSLWLLMTLPALARSENFQASLGEAGFAISPRAWESSVGFVAEVTRALEMRLGRDAGTFSSVAMASLRQVLYERLGRSAGALFGTDEHEIARTWAAFGTPAKFAVLAQDYLANFLERTTQYYLSRELPQKLGPDRRFTSLEDITAFNQELAVWCRERAGIATEFAKSWLSKELFERGRPSLDDARGFVGYALSKVGSEVRAHNE